MGNRCQYGFYHFDFQECYFSFFLRDVKHYRLTIVITCACLHHCEQVIVLSFEFSTSLKLRVESWCNSRIN